MCMAWVLGRIRATPCTRAAAPSANNGTAAANTHARAQVPSRVYFGRRVGAYDHIVVQRYTLKTRPYIGPTSMDTEMAFIMCNQAKVRWP